MNEPTANFILKRQIGAEMRMSFSAFLFNRMSKSLGKRGKIDTQVEWGEAQLHLFSNYEYASTKRLIEWVHELNEVIGYKSSVQISAQL